eukprot:jgi/Tetstr1/453830/TSEL_003994.t1
MASGNTDTTAGAAAPEDGPAEDRPEVEAPSVVQAHRDVFNKRLREYMAQRRDNQTLLTEAEYNEAMQTLRTFDQTTREERSRAWATKRRFDILTCGDSDMLIQKGDINVPLEQVKLASHAGMVFEHIRDLHLKGVHAKLKKLHKMILGRYIPMRVVKLFCETCATCAKHRTTKVKAKAGHRPILSKGMFGARGQIDLIDYQSSEHKGYRFLLTYIDHGIKFCFCTPIPNKEVPYNALFGQPPRVGISKLPISAELMDSLVTEADLNMALGLEEDDMIENHRENVLAPEKQAEEDEEEQHAEKHAQQEQQPQEEEDMDAFITPAPLPLDLPITSSRNEDEQTLCAYVPDPNLPWDPEHIAPHARLAAMVGIARLGCLSSQPALSRVISVRAARPSTMSYAQVERMMATAATIACCWDSGCGASLS